jgi:hypothetical protein
MGARIMSSYYDFDDSLAASKTAIAQDTDAATIKSMLSKCVDVRPADKEMDEMGVDYIATILGGREVYIDTKTRLQGCSKYWKAKTKRGEVIPELAIETWSVMPSRTYEGKIGWTLDYEKKTDLILYRFDKDDHARAFLLCFHTLRMAAEKKIKDWGSACKVDRQINNRYYSEAVFVRADYVLDAMRQVQCGFSAPERVFYIQELLHLDQKMITS